MTKLTVLQILKKPGAFAEQSSTIIAELEDEEAARRLARKLAIETGRQVIVRDAESAIIDIIAAPIIN